MIKHILLGNTITINVKGDFSDVNNVRVYIIDPRFNRKPLNYTIDNGGLVILYQGKEQKYYGMYSIVVIKNQGMENQEVIKKEYLFCLVGCSEDATDPNEIDIDTTFQVGVLGASINGMKSELDDIKKKIDEFDFNVITNLEKKHDTEITELTDKHNSDINEINKEVQSLTDKITGMENEHDTDINEINVGIQSISDRITEMEKGYDSKINEKVGNLESTKADKSEITDVMELINTKQDSLISGTNIKTINGESLLGEGNIEIKSGGEIPEELKTIPQELSELKDLVNQNSNLISNINDEHMNFKYYPETESYSFGDISTNSITNKWDIGTNICSFSNVLGEGLQVSNRSEVAVGRFNLSYNTSSFTNGLNTLFSVGCGESENNRANGLMVMQDGNVYINKCNGNNENYQLSEICKKVDWGSLKSLAITPNGTIPYDEYIPKGTLAVGEYCTTHSGGGNVAIGYGVKNNSQNSLVVGENFSSEGDSYFEVGGNQGCYFKVDVNGDIWVYSSGHGYLINITEKFREMGWVW